MVRACEQLSKEKKNWKPHDSRATYAYFFLLLTAGHGKSNYGDFESLSEKSSGLPSFDLKWIEIYFMFSNGIWGLMVTEKTLRERVYF